MSDQVGTFRARLFLILVSLGLVSIGYGIHATKDVETLLPNWWFGLFIAGALSSAVFARYLNRRTYLLSGMLVPGVLLLRVWATADRAHRGEVDWERVWVSVGTYGLMALSLATIWIFLFKPLTHYYTHARR